MKPHLPDQKKQALTRVDALVSVAMVALLFIIFVLPACSRHSSGPSAKSRATTSGQAIDMRINCVSNLKQVNLAYRIWEGDHNNKYPMQVPASQGGAMEAINDGNVAGLFQVMSNELSTPKVLVCPADAGCVPAKNFETDLDNSHVSYFVGVDAQEMYPQELLSGDDNLSVDRKPVESGIVNIQSANSVSWTPGRHGKAGNIGYADGSVEEASTVGLRTALSLALTGSGLHTNRLAIP